MTAIAQPARSMAWWREPTKDQWFAFVASWLGWTLDAFDFTIFLLIMVPISQEFHVPLAAVTTVFTLTFLMRFVGATASGWLCDRIGRKTPLMISIAWYSACNFIAGFSPAFWFLFLFRALLGIGMGAEWPAGAALSMESWPKRSRGFMAAVLQGSWGIGFMLSSIAYGLLYDSIGWRGLLWIGVLPALAIVYIRFFVKEPEVWLENRRQQRQLGREVRAPLIKIFQRGVIWNTLGASWWMASAFINNYSVVALFPSYLQKELHLSTGMVALPIMLQNAVFFAASLLWGMVSDRFGRRWAVAIPAALSVPCAPLYLLTGDYSLIVIFFALQGAFAIGMTCQNPSYLSERFPTEIRGTATGFVYHQGAIWGGLVAPILVYLANEWQTGLAIPMLIGTVFGAVNFILATVLGPETRGTELQSDLSVA
jgi:MFS transporter, SHS family, lactate transporter